MNLIVSGVFISNYELHFYLFLNTEKAKFIRFGPKTRPDVLKNLIWPSQDHMLYFTPFTIQIYNI